MRPALRAPLGRHSRFSGLEVYITYTLASSQSHPYYGHFVQITMHPTKVTIYINNIENM
jgi:hypothetical protein